MAGKGIKMAARKLAIAFAVTTAVISLQSVALSLQNLLILWRKQLMRYYAVLN